MKLCLLVTAQIVIVIARIVGTVVIIVIVFEIIGVKSSTGGGDICPSPLLIQNNHSSWICGMATLTLQIQLYARK